MTPIIKPSPAEALVTALYLVPTPIGNFQEITPRAQYVLANVKRIYCENSKTAQQFLQKLGIKKQVISYHKYNESEKTNLILQDLATGHPIALMSEAGHPLISDPGYLAVQVATQNNYLIKPLSGSCAFLSAAIASGFNPQPLLFSGFLPRTSQQRQKALQKIMHSDWIVILYESGTRLAKLLSDIAILQPDVEVCLAKEITKKYEYFWRGTATTVLEQWLTSHQGGEYTLVINRLPVQMIRVEETEICELVHQLVLAGLSKSSAINFMAQVKNLNKQLIYNLYHSWLKTKFV